MIVNTAKAMCRVSKYPTHIIIYPFIASNLFLKLSSFGTTREWIFSFYEYVPSHNPGPMQRTIYIPMNIFHRNTISFLCNSCERIDEAAPTSNALGRFRFSLASRSYINTYLYFFYARLVRPGVTFSIYRTSISTLARRTV